MTDSPKFWTRWLRPWLTLPLIALNGWVFLQIVQYFEPFFTVFVLASVFAFVLNYPVRALQSRGVQRPYAVMLVITLSLLSLVALGITLLPILLTQVNEVITTLPTWLDLVTQRVESIQQWAEMRGLPVSLVNLLDQAADRLSTEEVENLANQTLSLTFDVVDAASSTLLTLVLTLYLLLDGERVWNAIFKYLPFRHPDRIRESLHQDFQSYFIGQATLGVITGSTLSLAFFLLGVPYSLLLGLAVGLVTLVPFGDTLSFITISLLLMTQNLALGVRTLGFALVIDQVIDQIVAPRILGGFTGLKPIWVIIALLLGTKVFGLAGLLIAVPSASFLQTLLTDLSLLEREKSSTTPEIILASTPEGDLIAIKPQEEN